MRRQENAPMKFWSWQKGESSVDRTLRADRSRGDSFSNCRAAGADARSLWGGNRDLGYYAIHSRGYTQILLMELQDDIERRG